MTAKASRFFFVFQWLVAIVCSTTEAKPRPRPPTLDETLERISTAANVPVRVRGHGELWYTETLEVSNRDRAELSIVQVNHHWGDNPDGLVSRHTFLLADMDPKSIHVDHESVSISCYLGRDCVRYSSPFKSLRDGYAYLRTISPTAAIELAELLRTGTILAGGGVKPTKTRRQR